ncbi:MAG TPA: hypothetical protein VKF83_05395 [Stellaceae bacterium]|nr:hypothetical protein [Stellaceae bacterium]
MNAPALELVARDAVQLAGLPRDPDLGADDQRHREMHRDLMSAQ